MDIRFFGAAGEVTGSCHILTVRGRRVLLDCGLIQGSRKHERRNRDPWPFDPSDIDAVILSHAHIDHSGRLPLLVKDGYRGPVYAQNATRELCRIMLKDCGFIAEKEAESENRKRLRKGLSPVKPLFTVERELCTHAHITEAAGFRRCFEAGAPKHPVTDTGVPPLLARGVRVYTQPQFQVELIEPQYEEG